MMRIKEAIQRKKLIHEMNEEWKDLEYDLAPGLSAPQPVRCPSPMQRKTSRYPAEESDEPECRLQNFVQYLSGRLTDLQKRALKITWKRLSEAPKTSGRGTIHIMEKVLTMLCEKAPGVNAIFYKSAFLSCIEDRKCGRVQSSSIATIRDHAHILIALIDDILHIMFEGPLQNPKYDPVSIGEAHCRLGPLGFDRSMWEIFGECFAEVMFMQECIRAYPHAPSAWSLLSVALTDRIFAANKSVRPFTVDPSSSTTSSLTRLDSLRQPRGMMDRKSVSMSVAPTSKKDVMSKSSLSSLNFDRTNSKDDDVFTSSKSYFDRVSKPTTPFSTHSARVFRYSQEESYFAGPVEHLPEVQLPKQTHRSCPFSTFGEPSIPARQHEPPKFLRSKSEARIRLRRGIQSTDV